jgi:cytochrome d ubiquinol oxidase subunit II
MSEGALASYLFFMIGTMYLIYTVQEMAGIGAGIMNRIAAKNDPERKQIQVVSGLYSDGIEVWLIVAVGLLFAAFPSAFGELLSGLYMAMYLLLIMLIFRGLSVELIFKDDTKQWRYWMSIVWIASGVGLMLVLGVYFVNLFIGLPIDSSGVMAEVGLSIFNVPTLAGGVMFIVLAMIIGSVWIGATTEGPLGERAWTFVKKYGFIYVPPFLMSIIWMGVNNATTSIFVGDLFLESNRLLYALPFTSIIALFVMSAAAHFDKKKIVYVAFLIAMIAFFATGFIGTFPNVIFSSEDLTWGYQLADVAVGIRSLTLLSVVLSIFLPIVIGYQSFKYLRFFKEKVGLEPIKE